MIFGFIIGNFVGYIAERKTGLIFSKTIMKKLNKYPFLENLNFNNEDNIKRDLEILSKSSFFEKNKKIALLSVGKIKSNTVDFITTKLQNEGENKLLFNTAKLSEALNFESIILITQIGITNKEELLNTQRLLSFNKKNCLGMIIIDDLKVSKNISLYKISI